MIKKIIRKIELAKHYCDICEKEVSFHYQLGGTQCIVCEKDLCERHRKTQSGDVFGDSAYCPSCYKVGQKYFSQLKTLRKKFDKDFEKIEVNMKKECLKALKK